MHCHGYRQFSSKWNVKLMNSMINILLILLIRCVLFQSNIILCNAIELSSNSNLNGPDEQQRAQALAKLMTLFYTSDAFNKYMENLDAYYMLRGRPRFGKRNSYHRENNYDGVMQNHLLNSLLRQQLLRKFPTDNLDNDGDENFVIK
uniref:Clone ZZD196 mRNA sequence n=1 Tax=Schistosoma japonicum TaxID=6182 RepID=Q86FJ0_SCHJA|nr:hypothetical protein [Schistosoma japonicum]